MPNRVKGHRDLAETLESDVQRYVERIRHTGSLVRGYSWDLCSKVAARIDEIAIRDLRTYRTDNY